MAEYICTGICGGISNKPGVCQAKDCPQHGQPLVLEEELVLEDDTGEGENALSPAERIKKLKEKLAQAVAEKQDYLAQAQRFKADYLNLKRETEAERLTMVKFAKEDVLRDLVDLADNFELAFADKALWEAVADNWRQGVEAIHTKLVAIFRQHGLEEINPAGLAFDPALQQSVGVEMTDLDSNDNIVKMVVQKGYKLHGKLIRPAKVKLWQKS